MAHVIIAQIVANLESGEADIVLTPAGQSLRKRPGWQLMDVDLWQDVKGDAANQYDIAYARWDHWLRHGAK